MMVDIVTLLLTIGAGALPLPASVLLAEVLAAYVPKRRESDSEGGVTFSIVVPAHDEAQVIERTLIALKQSIDGQTRIIVVADNCTDATADIARSAGAEVVERKNETERGKGYALAAGIKYLRADPPDVVVFFDADTIPEDQAVRRLVDHASRACRPVQAVYLLNAPADAGPRASVSALAFTTKNLVRPAGLARLGMPCHITGSGFALPWSIASSTALASGNIVEDMQLGVDLAIAGQPVTLCESALVLGQLPAGTDTAATQRRRWEHGHLRTLFTQCPRLLIQAVRQVRLSLAVLALDLAVPPLALLTAGLVGMWVLACLWAATVGPSLPLWISSAGCFLLLSTVFLAWLRSGRDRIPLKSLLSVPFYVAWKLPIYAGFLLRRETVWQRTKRQGVQ